MPHEQAFADAELADALASSLIGGAQGLPKMDQITAAAIAADIAAGNYASAIERARDFAVSKGVAATLGTTASGFLAAISAGEALGVRGQAHFGRGRLNALYTNLSRDTNAAGWPASYEAAMRNDFFADRFNAAILPIVHWLRRQTGQTGSDRYFAEMAYGMMVARRDFEQGCVQHGLSGRDCTPERLAEEEARQLEYMARMHAVDHSVNLRLLEIARLARESVEAERARQRAEREREQAAALEAALAREAALAAERAAEEAEAAAAREAEARDVLDAIYVQSDLTPPPVPPGAISQTVLDTEISDNRTVYRVRLTNTSSEALFGVGAAAYMRTPAPDSGVAIVSGGNLRTLEPGESMVISFMGDGNLDAVLLYVTGAGELLGAFEYPMLHDARPDDDEDGRDDAHHPMPDEADTADANDTGDPVNGSGLMPDEPALDAGSAAEVLGGHWRLREVIEQRPEREPDWTVQAPGARQHYAIPSPGEIIYRNRMSVTGGEWWLEGGTQYSIPPEIMRPGDTFTLSSRSFISRFENWPDHLNPMIGGGIHMEGVSGADAFAPNRAYARGTPERETLRAESSFSVSVPDGPGTEPVRWARSVRVVAVGSYGRRIYVYEWVSGAGEPPARSSH